jgi:hypothetical protein
MGSHGLKRKNAKPDRGHADNAKRLAKVALDGNRRLLACLPVEPDTRALADDPHCGPYMTIPGKDNGFDIEGLAADRRREPAARPAQGGRLHHHAPSVAA